MRRITDIVTMLTATSDMPSDSGRNGEDARLRRIDWDFTKRQGSSNN
jgi:hypothetical protein